MDVAVYTCFMDGIDRGTYDFIQDTWNRLKGEYTHYVYFPIEFESVDDGVRSVNEDWRRKIDDLFKSELDSIGKAYLTVTGSPMQRVDQILNFIK
jgi:predicted transcriptional regulator